MNIPQVTEPTNRADLLRELRSLHQASTEIWGALSPEERFRPQGDKWSPAQHLDHLNRSNGPVGKALSLPKPALLLRFGPSFRGSRSLAEVQAIYLGVLESGAAQARGRYRPDVPPQPEEPEQAWQALLDRRQKAADRLHENIGLWGDFALDRLRLPHPITGQMTVREMLYFTLYHNQHHIRRVVERRGD